MDVISGLTLTGSNYAVAIQFLEQRYGSTIKQIAAHNLAISKVPNYQYNGRFCDPRGYLYVICVTGIPVDILTTFGV